MYRAAGSRSTIERRVESLTLTTGSWYITNFSMLFPKILFDCEMDSILFSFSIFESKKQAYFKISYLWQATISKCVTNCNPQMGYTFQFFHSITVSTFSVKNFLT